jgi:hypothetical protein
LIIGIGPCPWWTVRVGSLNRPRAPHVSHLGRVCVLPGMRPPSPPNPLPPMAGRPTRYPTTDRYSPPAIKGPWPRKQISFSLLHFTQHWELHFHLRSLSSINRFVQPLRNSLRLDNHQGSPELLPQFSLLRPPERISLSPSTSELSPLGFSSLAKDQNGCLTKLKTHIDGCLLAPFVHFDATGFHRLQHLAGELPLPSRPM